MHWPEIHLMALSSETKASWKISKSALILVLLLGLPFLPNAQCGINTFPYFENFETGPGIWSSGGVNSSWTYGSPSKPVISSAASVANCWTTGGLTGSSYNNLEHSTLTSSCFDFSSLNYPFISFKIFWETEKKFDGGNLQSSIDGGTTWVNVGAFGDAVDCNTDNWFNYNPITYLGSPAWITVRHGWSGNIQPNTGSCLGGNGSGTWVLAKHCLTGLNNQPNVLLRFTFGSGSTCNAYDGLAIDDITISDGAVIQPDFTYSCGANNAFSFLGSTPCTAAQSWSWDFGDPSSGSNTSSAINPTHTFSTPGTYTVTATLSGGACNPPGTISKTIQVLGGTISNVNNPSCAGLSDGSAEAITNSGVSPFSFLWSNGETSPIASQLQPGNNSVTITDNIGCTVNYSISLTAPPLLLVSLNAIQASCGSLGSATANASGGNAPYTFSWNSSPVQTSATATNLPAGNYTVIVTDNNGCSATDAVEITASNSLTVLTSGDQQICAGGTATLWVNVSNGTAPFSYSWSPGGEINPSISVSPTTNSSYSVTVTDALGCTTGPLNLNVVIAPAPLYSPTSDTAVCAGKTILLTVSDDNNQNLLFTWNPGGVIGNSLSVSPIQSTCYYLSIEDTIGCVVTDSVRVSVSPGISPSFTGSNLKGCAPLCALFTNASLSSTDCAWNFGDGQISSACDTVTHCFTNVGMYDITLSATDTNGCLGSVIIENYIEVTNGPIASFTFSPETITEEGESLFFQNRSQGATTFQWSMIPSAWHSTEENPSTFYPDGNECVVVNLIAGDSNRCTDSSSIKICLKTDYTFYIPNAFTADFDYLNTEFKPKGTGIMEENYEMKIYNRWGMELFRTKNILEGWDGRIKETGEIAPQDVYTYRIQCMDVQYQRIHHYFGKVVLIK